MNNLKMIYLFLMAASVAAQTMQINEMVLYENLKQSAHSTAFYSMVVTQQNYIANNQLIIKAIADSF